MQENPTNTPHAEGAPPVTPPVKRRGRRLGSLKAVRAAVAWLWRETESGRMEPLRAKILTSIAYALMTSLEKTDVEQRLTALEAVVAGGGRAGVVRPLSRQASGQPPAA